MDNRCHCVRTGNYKTQKSNVAKATFAIIRGSNMHLIARVPLFLNSRN